MTSCTLIPGPQQLLQLSLALWSPVIDISTFRPVLIRKADLILEVIASSRHPSDIFSVSNSCNHVFRKGNSSRSYAVGSSIGLKAIDTK